MKKDLRDPTLPFVKTVGPEVFGGNFGCAGEQNYRSHLDVGFCSLTYMSPQTLPPVLTRGEGLM